MMRTAESATRPEPASSRARAIDMLTSRSMRMVLVLLLLWAVLALHPETRASFLTAGNFSNLTAQVAEIVIIGVGMTLVICIKGIDLSVGAGMALFGVIAAKLQIDGKQSMPVAVAVSLVVATLVGTWHGVLTSRFRIPAFIATLSGFLAYRGIGLVLSDARGLSPMSPDFAVLGARVPRAPSIALCLVACVVGVAMLVLGDRRRAALGLPSRGGARLAIGIAGVLIASAFSIAIYQDGMPVPVLIAGAATALGASLLSRSRLGRYAFAIGGNAEAARLSGVPVERVTILVYALTGLLTGLAAMIATARTNGVTPGNAGLMRELHVISAVVIGGTSLTGGRATMVGTVIGALIFGTLSNGMNLFTINSNWQLILTGAILLGASLLDSLSTRAVPGKGDRVVKVVLAATAAGAFVFLLAARGKSSVAASGSGPQVALLLSTLQEERYQKDKKYFEDEARRLGTVPFTLGADNDNARQLSQVEDALSRGAKVLVIQATDSNAAGAYVAKAHEKGAKVVAYDRGIAGTPPDVYVAHDSYAVGRMQAEAAVRATGGKGNYVLLIGQSGHSVAMEIARGYREVLAPYVASGAITIVVEKNHDAWSPEQALATVEDALAKSSRSIAAILANNSGMARGAVQAILAAGLGDKHVFIAGADADAANVNYVCEGKQSVEVLKDIKPLAEKAAEVASQLARGDASAPKGVIAVPVHLVTKDNVRPLLIDSGFHAASALPSCK